MLGKSAGSGCISLCLLLLVSCAHTVSQDANTGADGKTKGAKSITLENGEGKANGIVTYPGGDRVDWKVVDLPPNSRGTMDVELKWTPPRPGLQLNFDVFDEWGQSVSTSKKIGKRKSRIRTASVEKASALTTKYFIRIYAQNRGDAGKYKLTVDFHESADTKIDWAKVDVNEPPKLPAVPVEIEPCDDVNFDPKKPECRSYCPHANAPAGWAPCANECPDPPDPQKKACWSKVCPSPPTVDSKACMANPKKFFPPCPDVNNPDPDNPNCPKNRPPFYSRIVDNSISGSETVITIAGGSDKGVSTDWRGVVLKGDDDAPADGGDITVVRVSKTQTLGKVRLTPDQLAKTHLKVKLIPPGK